jgi:hypothetical protein
MRVFFLTLITVLASGVVALAVDPAEWFPLAEGCTWTMEARLVSPNGNVTPTTAHRVIEGVVERDGHKYNRVRTWMDLAPKNQVTKLIRLDETGVYTVDENEKGATEQREAVFPLKIGETWKRMSKTSALKDALIGVEPVTVGDSTYDNCLHFRSTSPETKFSEDRWEAPGVGSIKSVMNFPNGAKILLTLREFKPGKQ